MEKRGRGRPKGDPETNRTKGFRLRMSQEEWDDLEVLSTKLGISKSDAIRNCVHYYFSNFCVHK